MQLPPDILTNEEAFRQFEQNQAAADAARWPAAGRGRALSRPEVEPELPRPAVAARRHREPHRGRAARLHPGGSALQHRDADLPGRLWAMVYGAEPMATFTATPAPSRRRASTSELMRPRPLRPSVRAAAPRCPARDRRVQAARAGFPPLTGRVVDDAGLLERARRARARRGARPARAGEPRTVVVVTLPSLQGCRSRTTATSSAATGASARRARTTARS